ncbi:putative threonine-rich GPI-anchored glycoprotein-like [Pimephales promelas]|nr:putative threonine-rich GPI-anchored glycoprotein-like [Pimephales promelas]
MDILDDMGLSKLSATVFLKVTSFKCQLQAWVSTGGKPQLGNRELVKGLIIGTRGDLKRTMSPLVVLLIIIGLLGPTCENQRNVSDSAVSHHKASSDQIVINRNQLNNRALENWPVANRTDIKIFRKGSLVISRQYWYPVLEIAVKKPNPTSPAFTLATTPIISNTAQSLNTESLPATTSMLPTSSFPTTAETSSLGQPSTTKTTISTISTEPQTTSIQVHTSKQMTSRQISETTESQISTLPKETNPTTTIVPTANSRQPTTMTYSATSVQQKTATANNVPSDTSKEITATTSTVSLFPETITPSATPETTSIQLTNNINTRNMVGTSEETSKSVGTTTSIHTTTVMDASNAPEVTGTTISSANLPATSGSGVSFESLKTTSERTLGTAELDSTSVAPGTTRAATTIIPKTVATTEAVTIFPVQSAIKSTDTVSYNRGIITSSHNGTIIIENRFSNTKVVTEINSVYEASNLRGYRRSRVESFTRGSIKVEMSLIFVNSSMVPSPVEVESVLYGNAINGSILLNITLDTIKAEEIVTSNTPFPNATIQTTTMESTASTGENTNTTSGAFSQMASWFY